MFYQFYNTRTGTVMLEYTSRCTASFGFAKSINPNISPNAITKGMQVYDYKSMQYFSLTLDEALLVANLLESRTKVSLGTVVGEIKQTQPTQNNPQPVQFYEVTVTHFPGTKEQKAQGMKSVSKLVIRLYSNLSGSLALYKDDFSCSVPFGTEGYFVLLSFLRTLPTFISTLDAMSTYEAMKQREQRRENNQTQYQQQELTQGTPNTYQKPYTTQNTRPYSEPVTDVLQVPPLEVNTTVDATSDMFPASSVGNRKDKQNFSF